MPSIEALGYFFEEHSQPCVRYLQEMHIGQQEEPEEWRV
jgi:hypothetical protein